MRTFSKWTAACVGLTGMLVAGSAAAQDPVATPEPGAAVGVPSNPTPGVSAPDGSPVVRAGAGNWGMSFTFGGLASLNVGGIDNFNTTQAMPPTGGPLFTELGARYVTKSIIVPFSVGLGIFNTTTTPPNNAPSTSATDFGLSASVGIYKPFRVWRRISPYLGGLFRIGYVNPTGDKTYDVGIAIGPVAGVEYYIADRVSLYAQGQFLFGVNISDPQVQIHFGTLMTGGGQMGLNFYF